MESNKAILQGESSTKRVMKNTIALYFRQIINLVVSLYTVRIVLATLGEEDYGIYNVVGGVITTFGFLSSTLASATQRFFSVQIAKKNDEKLKKVFCLSFTLSLIIVGIIIVLGETIGLWLVKTQLIIPANRMSGALVVYQITIFSFVLSIINSTYMACIIAHENMNIYAYIAIAEVVLKLLIVYLLRIISFDKLIIYGLLQGLVNILITSAYHIYCRKKYFESRVKFLWDKTLFKEINSYMGWNMLGTISATLRSSGMGIVLNIFFGPLINTAYGIANQVNNAITSFYTNFTTAYKPQIVKTYNSDRHEDCMRLLFRSTKISYLLMYFIGLPVILEAPFILEIWLGEVPEHTILFTRLVLMTAMVESLSQGLIALMSAQGRLKEYQLVVSGITLLTLPISWIVLRLGAYAESVSIVMFFIAVISFVARMLMLKWLAQLPLINYCKETILPIIKMTVVSLIIPVVVENIVQQNFIGFFIVGCSCVVSVGLAMWFLCLSYEERNSILQIIREKMNLRKG